MNSWYMIYILLIKFMVKLFHRLYINLINGYQVSSINSTQHVQRVVVLVLPEMVRDL
jgi:hypothetical protein